MGDPSIEPNFQIFSSGIRSNLVQIGVCGFKFPSAESHGATILVRSIAQHSQHSTVHTLCTCMQRFTQWSMRPIQTIALSHTIDEKTLIDRISMTTLMETVHYSINVVTV